MPSRVLVTLKEIGFNETKSRLAGASKNKASTKFIVENRDLSLRKI
jgi:hypothetical protein